MYFPQKVKSMYLNVRFISGAAYLLYLHYTFCNNLFIVGYAVSTKELYLAPLSHSQIYN